MNVNLVDDSYKEKDASFLLTYANFHLTINFHRDSPKHQIQSWSVTSLVIHQVDATFFWPADVKIFVRSPGCFLWISLDVFEDAL